MKKKETIEFRIEEQFKLAFKEKAKLKNTTASKLLQEFVYKYIG